MAKAIFLARHLHFSTTIRPEMRQALPGTLSDFSRKVDIPVFFTNHLPFNKMAAGHTCVMGKSCMKMFL